MLSKKSKSKDLSANGYGNKVVINLKPAMSPIFEKGRNPE